jgi:hypothetical protein
VTVEFLEYEIVALAEGDTLEAEHSTFELGGFNCEVEGTKLRAIPIREVATTPEAREQLEPHLRDWEAELDIACTLPVQFRFSGASVTHPEEHTEVVITSHLTLSDSLSVHRKLTFSAPSGRIKDGPIITLLRARWVSRARFVQEPIPAAAYAFVTFVEDHFGGGDLRAAGQRLNVSRKVLERVKELSSRGSPPTVARKIDRKGGPALSSTDLAWLAKTIEVLGRRAAEVESGTSPAAKITLADLP